jgi:hypothetical protein
MDNNNSIIAVRQGADLLVERLIEADRALRAATAARYRALCALAAHPIHARDPVQDAAVEVACALRIAERTAQQHLADARVLTALFPETLQQLEDGQIQPAQVRALIESTAALDTGAARAVQELVLPKMPDQNPAATRKALARAVIKVDPHAAEARRQAAHAARHVAHYPQPDGMSTLAATLPAAQAAHAWGVIDAHARAAQSQRPEAGRTLEQARADCFYQLLTGNTQQYPPAMVQVTVPLDTLLGTDRAPGELTGYGPVTAHTARALAAHTDSLWRRLLTEPATGLLVKTDPHTYRPTAEVRRHVSARDAHCAFPTCTMPAARTDLDHIVAFNHHRPQQGGPSTPDNLHPLCRHHHNLKTAGGWSVHPSETDATTWSAPSGRRYTTATAT